ncbi:JRKL [Branchiostoma lanceolatum]|uniref:JRKL protein n=1 Tax=Branchiostoma lanceolatum TaxID=7740 RepID=A0A8J9Z6U1_BRALA|nr:JRKL [Branchiostoma lanceolatum]
MSDRHRRYREWEESDMQEAIRMIAEQSKSVYAAAKALNIPRVTLHDRFNQRHGDKVGRPPKLSAEDETALVQYSMYMATKGFPLTAGVMKALAKEVDKESSKQRGEEPRFGGKTPGKKWWKSFRLRHPEISLRTPDSLDRARAAMSNKNVVADHFKKLGDIIDQHNLSERPYLIYNADETGMALDARRSRVIVPTASKRAPAVKSGSRDHITVMACVSAGGGVIPPMIVYDRALPSGLFSDGGPSGAVYAHSDSGYMTRELFEKWFFCNFLPHCHKARPLLLILDQATCHLSLKVLQTAIQEKIVIYGLPPHTSQYTQPLDVSIFASVKAKWANTIESLQASNMKFQAKKSTFARIYSSVQDQSFSPQNIKSGFKKTGIYPFDPQAIDNIWKEMSNAVQDAEGPSCSTSVDTGTSDKDTPKVCDTCGNQLVNPIAGTLVPAHLHKILRPTTTQNGTVKQTRRKKLSARVMTHEDLVEELKKKEEDEKEKRAKGEERKKKAETKRKEKEAKEMEKEEKRKEKEAKEMEKEEKRKEKETKEMEKEEKRKEKGGMKRKREEKDGDEAGQAQDNSIEESGTKRTRRAKKMDCYEYNF